METLSFVWYRHNESESPTKEGWYAVVVRGKEGEEDVVLVCYVPIGYSLSEAFKSRSPSDTIATFIHLGDIERLHHLFPDNTQSAVR